MLTNKGRSRSTDSLCQFSTSYNQSASFALDQATRGAHPPRTTLHNRPICHAICYRCNGSEYSLHDGVRWQTPRRPRTANVIAMGSDMPLAVARGSRLAFAPVEGDRIFKVAGCDIRGRLCICVAAHIGGSDPRVCSVPSQCHLLCVSTRNKGVPEHGFLVSWMEIQAHRQMSFPTHRNRLARTGTIFLGNLVASDSSALPPHRLLT